MVDHDCGCTPSGESPLFPPDSLCPPNPCVPIPVPVPTCEEVCDVPAVEVVPFDPENPCDNPPCGPRPTPVPVPTFDSSGCNLQLSILSATRNNTSSITVVLSASGTTNSVEYSLNNQYWQDNNSFTILNPVYPISFYVREKNRTWCRSFAILTGCSLQVKLLQSSCQPPVPVPITPIPISPSPVPVTPVPVQSPVPVCTSLVTGIRCHNQQVPSPVAPVTPIAPVSPVAPVAPVSPISPTTPVAPVAPVPTPTIPTPVACGGLFSGLQKNLSSYYIYPNQTINVFGATSINLTYTVYDNPNRFTIRNGLGAVIWTSDWRGTSTISGPWGQDPLSTINTETVNINVSGQSILTLQVEAAPGGQGLSDSWDVSVSCVNASPTPSSCNPPTIGVNSVNGLNVTLGMAGYVQNCQAIVIEYSQDSSFSSFSTASGDCTPTRIVTVSQYGLWYFRAKKLCPGGGTSTYSSVVTRNVVQPTITSLNVSQSGNELLVSFNNNAAPGPYTYVLRNENGQIVSEGDLPQIT